VKIYRTKRRSCKLCKPHKMGLEKMWKAKVLAKLKAMEQEARDLHG
jgi:NADH:ubiquinone oxidoreductase subunit F (NADH-binding)